MSNNKDDFADSPKENIIREKSGDRIAHYFMGQQLHPFSFGYEAAFYRIPVDGPVEASVMLIYLLTIDRRTVDRETRTDEGIEIFREKMQDWAGALGISCVPRDGKFNEITNEAIRVGNEIWDEAQASAFKTKPSIGTIAEPAPPNE